MNGMAEKETIREAVTARRRELDAGWVARSSRAVQEAILSLPELGEAGVVACYLALPGEVRTELIVEECRRDGKTVCVPAFDPARAAHGMCRLTADAKLAPGAFGVMEPQIKEWVDLAAVRAVIVPGLAFDARGGRIGRGGAHYDRLLRAGGEPPPAFKVGAAFEFQVWDRVPLEGHDVSVDAVVTEQRTMRCAKRAA